MGTDIEVPIAVLDQEMGTATLTVTCNASVYAVQLSQGGYSIDQPITVDNPVAIGKTVYQPGFVTPIAGSQTQYFRPDMPGTYAFILSATDAAGNSAKKSMTVRAVASGETPGPIEGAPAVVKLAPEDKSADIMVGTPIVVTFSEPIDSATLNGDSFLLMDLTTGTQIAADIYTAIEGGMMTATLQPRTNLAYGHEYEIVLTRDIKDSNSNASSNGEFLPLDQEYHYYFTTKAPGLYDLANGFELTPGGTGGKDIALYTDRENGHTYSYVTAEEAGWRAVDVTDPTKPVVTYKVNYSQPPDTATPHVSWRFRGAAVDQETGILALTEWIIWDCVDCGNYGYVGFYDVQADPATPTRIGRERLAEEFSGVPSHVVLSGNYAYVQTIGVGIQVVDIEKSKGTHQPGEAIAGYCDTVDEGYGHPYDIAILKGNLYVPTSKGHLLILGTANPAFPDLIGKIDASSAFRAWRVSVIGDYTFVDAAGTPQTMDLAFVYNGTGNIYIVNVTDPHNPIVLATIGGTYASDVSIARNGLLYVTDGTTVDVIDIKDPYNPKRLNDISGAENAEGADVSLGYSSALVEKDGWVYLANQQYGMRVLDLDPFQVKIVDIKYKDVREVKYCNDEEIGNSYDKERNDKKAFYVKVTTMEKADTACPKMRGTISVRSGSGTDEKIIEAPAGIDYQAKYDLIFEKESDKVCIAKVGVGGNSRFLLSNRKKESLSNIASTTFIYGGIRPGRIYVEVELNGAGSSLSGKGNQKPRAEAKKQQVQVIVLAIDGLRQDVLYDNGVKQTKASYSDTKGCGNVPCNIEITATSLPGLSQILKGCDQPKDKQQYIMLPDVTAIFPSITIASWASIFTGKMPKETGIPGNEFFARDLSGGKMMTFGDGAFPMMSMFDRFPKFNFGNTSGKGEADKTLRGDAKTVYESIKQINSDLRSAVVFNDYSRGANKWFYSEGVIDRFRLFWNYFTKDEGDIAELLDSSPADDSVNYINSSSAQNRFPTLLTIYLAGLDHSAHYSGMNGYVEFFKSKTDVQIKKIADALKEANEFDNKIFIIVADHGHTAMPTDLKYKDTNWLGKTVQKDAEMSCKLKVDIIDPENPDNITSAQRAEQANNNLHIWELGELFKHTGSIKGTSGLNFSVIAPADIASIYEHFSYGAKPDSATANIIAAFNGPMAHLYVKNRVSNDWDSPRLVEDIGYTAELLRLSLSKDKSPSNLSTLFSPGLFERAIPILAGLKRLINSIDIILIRRGSNYEVFQGIKADGSDIISSPLNSYAELSLSKYVDAANRIEKMNDVKRSGDIVLIMKDDANILQEEIESHRYTTGVACKSWHGSLNPSDSYVPLIVAYPGGNKKQVEPLINSACPTGCGGNWSVTDLIKTFIQQQYGSQ